MNKVFYLLSAILALTAITASASINDGVFQVPREARDKLAIDEENESEFHLINEKIKTYETQIADINTALLTENDPEKIENNKSNLIVFEELLKDITTKRAERLAKRQANMDIYNEAREIYHLKHLDAINAENRYALTKPLAQKSEKWYNENISNPAYGIVQRSFDTDAMNENNQAREAYENALLNEEIAFKNMRELGKKI